MRFYSQGYLFISVLVSASSDLMRLVIQSIKNDLSSRNPIHINLALQCIANIGSREMAEAFCQDIPKILVSGSVTSFWMPQGFHVHACESVCFCRDTIDSVKQSSALCLLRLIRSNPDAVPMSEWALRVIHLLNDQHMV